MSGPFSPSSADGSGTESPTPVEIIYLDRGRLFSYASQLYDGLTLLRRTMSAVERGQVDSTDEVENETETETITEGEASIEFGVHASGKRSRAEKARHAKKSGFPTI